MKIAAIIVTYNRLEKLKKVIKAFNEQIVFPDKVFVVDNNSSDGTLSCLKEWELDETLFQKQVISLDSNVGGSGGFYIGMKLAFEQGYDWIWLSDDDAYPASDSISKAVDYLAVHETNKIAAVCGTVLDKNGIDCSHRRNIYNRGLKIADVPSSMEDYQKDEFLINAFSYVGVLLNRVALEKVGFTLKDYFIWCDDTEHSLRISKVGDIVCVPSIKIYHDCTIASSNNLTWKDYYGQRNRLDMIRRNFPLYLYITQLIFQKIKVYSLKLRHKKESAVLLSAAISDCQCGKFGVHPVYKPGWKPEGD